MRHSNLFTNRILYLLPLVCLVLALAVCMPAFYTDAVPAQAQQDRPAAAWITPRGADKPFFVIGANYEGPTDWAWQMWEDDKFDPALIDADFARARSLGINTLRIFVQTPLRDDINGGDFSKLDAVTALAREYNMWLILTFTDWAEPDLLEAGELNGRIAAHLAGEPSILAYDVKNEPQFTDIVGAIYPSDIVTVPMQAPDLIAVYGERVSRADIGDYRRGEGRAVIPSRMTDEQAHVMANYYKLYVEFLGAGSAWVGTHAGTTTLDYMDSPDSESWRPYLSGLDATLQAWVNTQMDPVRAADSGRLITVGYSNVVFAKLASNRELSFQSVHRFTSHGQAGLMGTFRVLDNLQRTFAPQPVLLEEFGYPGQVRAVGGGVAGFDPRTTANLEGAVWTYLYGNGFAGGAKWMLNNFPQGYDPAQNSYGLFDDRGNPKITAHSLRHISELFGRSSPGSMSAVRPERNSAAGYAYTARDALIVGGETYSSTNVIYTAAAPSQLIVGTSAGTVTLFATDVATAELNLPGIFRLPTSEIGRINLTGLDPQGQPWTPALPRLAGDWLQIKLSPTYRYRLSVVPRAVERAVSQPGSNSVYFEQTGHNLGGEFLAYWQSHGGLSIFGYPLTEPFTENGYTVQYFERNRFELHPENQPPYNVLLGRLGADSTSERDFAQVEPFESGPDHRYFPETGHSLNYAFLGYWDRNGGLAQFGYPMSEEIREKSATDGKEYTVQYFERARFEYHPEYKGTSAEVLLGLLGVGAMKDKGWLP
ncbi:MAG TPA: hypothetical protein VGE45_16945 [Chloroflexia bacterium]